MALLTVPVLGLLLAPHTPLVQAAGVLTITDLTAPNIIGDSNIESKAGAGPEVFTIGAKFCNTGDDTLKDVFAYIGNGTTPGTFPTTTKTAPPYGGTFALDLLDADESDATRYLGDLAPGECVVVYWQVKYPVVDADGNAVWGLQASITDDLDLHWSVWGKGIDDGTGAPVTGSYNDTVWVRNEITAAANKVQPTPGGYTTIDPSTAVAPGQLVTVCYHNVKFGNVNQGFDVDGIPGPDYDLWFQPIGETFWNPDALRLVRIEVELRGTNCGGGKPDVTLTRTDTTYFSRLDQYGGCLWAGDYCYTFLALGTGSGTVTPYQEAASGSNNEKYNADYGGDDLAKCDNCLTVTSGGTGIELDKTVDKPTATDSEILTYTLTYTNTTSAPLGDPDTGNGVVIEDSIPANTTYVAGSATCSAGCTILYSTDGGATWSSTEPVDPTTVTDLRWVLNAPVPANGSGTVGFQVLVDTGFSGTVTNTGETKVDDGPTLDDDDAITCVNCAPEVQAFKTDSLFLDADGDGVPSPGDTLKYTIIIINDGNVTASGVVFTDDPDPNTSLIVGSVDLPQCPGCSVTSGNNPGDTSVGVNVGDLAPGASVEISFRVTIGTDGFTEVANQGTVEGTNFVSEPTDDPDTPADDDPTVTPVTIGPPELTITKFGPAEAVIDTTITYTGTLTNISDSTAYNVVLVDQLPAGVTFVSSSHTATYDPVANTVTWNLGTVPAGASIPGWLTVHIDSTVPNGTVLTNEFEVTWEDVGGNPLGPDTATTDTTVYTHPQLALDKEGPTEAFPEETFSYKLTIRNLGGMAAENVALTDTLPGDVSYVSSNPSGSHAAGVVTWNLGTIEAGGSMIVFVTVKVNAGVANETTLTNTASVDWDGADQPAEATWDTTVYTQAELVITKFGPLEAVVDSTITYTGTLTNIGGTTAYNVVLVDYLPAGVTFVSSSHTATYDPVANTVTWNLGDLAAGASIPGWLTVHIDPSVADGTVLHNTFHVTWEDEVGNPSGSDTATWDTTVHTNPLLTVTKSGPEQASPGDTINYTIRVENIGGTDALNVTLQDILPTGLTYVSSNPSGTHAAGVVTWDLGTIHAYGSKEVSISASVDATVENNTPLINTASVVWEDTLGQDYGPASDTHQTTIYTQPELVITKFGPAEAVVDSTITYTGTLTNVGGTVAKNVVLVDYLPAGVTFVSSSHAAVYDPGTHTVTWNLGDIAPGASIPGWLTVHIDPTVADGTTLHDIFSVTWKDEAGNDYGPAEASADTTVHTHPQLTVTKSGPEQASPGDTINYTIRVENIGGTDALNVTLQDILPTGLTYVSSNPSGTHAAGVVTWNLGTIFAYGSKEVSLVVKVDATVENNTPLINTVSVTWQDSLAQDYGPATDTHQTTIYTQPELVITKFGPAEAVVDSTITYTGDLTNVGGTVAKNVVLVDYLPAGVTFVSSSHAAVYNPVAHTVTWNLGDIPAGASIPGWLTVHIDPGVADGTTLHDIFSVTWKDEAGNDYGPAEASADTTAHTNPLLTVTKSGPEQASPGETINYTIRVENIGGTDALNVTLQDVLPTGLTYVSSNPSGTHAAGVVTWDLGTIFAYGSKEVSLVVKVDATVENNTPLVDTASVVWEDTLGQDYGPASDTHQTTIYTQPELVITKFGPAEAVVDSTITYTGTLTNVGGTVAKNVVLVDYLPAGVTFVSSSHAAVYNPVAHTVTWNLGDIPAGASIPGWLTVHIDPTVADGTTLHDIFSVTWKDEAGNDYGPAEASADTTVHTHPQLTVEKSGPEQASPGDTINYTIRVENIGGTDALNVTLQDVLPVGLTYVSSNPSGTHAAGVVTWNLGTIFAYGFKEVSISASVDATVENNTPLINTASVVWEDTLGQDYGPASDTHQTTIYTQPELTITKFGPAEAVVDSTITYTGTLTNVGGTVAKNVVLVDYLPAGVTFVSSSHTATYDPVANTVTWNLGDIAPGASIPGWLTVHIDPTVADGTTLHDIFSVTWKDEAGNDYGPAEASADTTVHTNPLLTVEKSGPEQASPGDTINYTIRVENIGGTDALNVTLQDILPTGLTYVSSNPSGTHAAGVVTWNLGTIFAYGFKEVSISASVDATVENNTPLINTASVVWEDTLGQDYGPASDTHQTTIYTQPELTITKFGPAEAVVDSTITYTGTLTNVGGTVAKNVVLVDYLPAGVTFVSSSHAAVYDPGTHTVTWNLGDIAPGASIPGWLTVHIDPTVADGTTLHDIFSVTWKDEAGNDYGPAEASADTTVHTHPQLTVTKSGPEQASPGDTINYTIRVENIGSTDALNVTLQDVLPAGLTYVSSNPSGTHAAGVVTWNLGTIFAYGFKEVSISASVDATVVNNTPLINTVSVTWQDSLGQDHGPASDTHQTTIYTQPQLTIEKSGLGRAYPGQTFSYAIEVCNVGGTPAVGTTLTDNLPDGLNYINSSHGGAHAAGVVTWNLGTIDTGDCVEVTLTVQVDAGVPDDTSLEDIASVSWSDSDGNDYGPVGDIWETVVNTHPQLTLVKTGPTEASQGEQITYEIEVCNTGGDEARDVTLQDLLPIGLTYVSSNPSGTHVDGVVTWNLGTIASDACKSVSVTVTVDPGLPAGAILVDTASVTWKDPGGNDYGPTTDTAETRMSVIQIVSGVVFNDLNGNGTQDAGEPGIGSVTVELLDADGNVVGTTTTAGDGSYIFTGIAAGYYLVEETDPAGYVSTTNNTVPVLVPEGGSATANFGDQEVGTVSGVVFNDLNGNGIQDPGEDGIGGVTVELVGADGNVVDTTTTAGDGSYIFTGVTAGPYTVTETDPTGYVSTTSNTVPVSVPPGGSATANFGDQQVGTVSGVVFNDLDGNGVQDAGEPGLGGVTVELNGFTTTTAGDGSYLFTGVTAGPYTVTETDPDGFVSTTNNTVPISVPAGGAATANFGDQQVGTVSGVVFNDLNGNGGQDAGEPGLGGVTVELNGFTTTTAGDGSYLFTGVTAGPYTVTETDPTGYVSTTSNTVPVSVPPGGSATANFGDQQVGTVSGVVFNDLDGNGVQDAGEPGIGGVTIDLVDADGNVVATTTTAGDGSYIFTGVTAGPYTIQETDPTDYVSTTSNTVPVSVPSGGSATANFGDQQVGTVSGVVFNDLNGNGVQDAGEPGLGGVTVELNGFTTTTAGDGSYLFAGVTAGPYTVTETDPTGYVSTTSNTMPVSVPPGGSATANFGDQQVGTVSGVVFNDLDGNGVQDAGEPGIGGVTVDLVDADGNVVATTTTAGDGSYIFTGVTAGPYTIQETDPTDYVSTTSNTVPVSVPSGGSATANFGDQQVGTVSGVVFNDLNGNGVQDAGEPGLGGVTVELNGFTTTTAGDGSYLFTGVVPGDYTVLETDPDGFVSTTNNTVPISVPAGGAATANFGDQQTGTVSGVVFNDLNGNGVQDLGEPGLGGVTVELNGFTTTTAGDGSYIFTGVVPGDYTVQETDPTGFTSTTPNSVPVTVPPGGAGSANFGDQMAPPPTPRPVGGVVVPVSKVELLAPWVVLAALMAVVVAAVVIGRRMA